MTWEAEISNELGSLFCTKRALGWWILILGSGTNFRLILVGFVALMWQNKVLDAWKVLSQGYEFTGKNVVSGFCNRPAEFISCLPGYPLESFEPTLNLSEIPKIG